MFVIENINCNMIFIKNKANFIIALKNAIILFNYNGFLASIIH